MDISNTLQTIAEVSIAFAGFSGLIVALRKSPGPLTKVQKFRLQVLLGLAFGALFLAFLPELLRSFGSGETTTWTAAITGLLIYSLLFNTWWVIASRRISRSAPEIFDWFAFSRMAAGHIVLIGLQVLILVTGASVFAPAAFLAGLIWFLLHAAQQFCRMLFVQAEE
jgi:hypothetical protein